MLVCSMLFIGSADLICPEISTSLFSVQYDFTLLLISSFLFRDAAIYLPLCLWPSPLLETVKLHSENLLMLMAYKNMELTK
jgi:hypothetical protein